MTGSLMQSTALIWVIYSMTHENRWPAHIATAQILPTFLLGAWGGSLADRWPKRELIFVTQSAALVQALLLFALVGAGVHEPWILVAVTGLGGLIQAIDFPARLAFVLDMTTREDLMNAVALNSAVFNVARVVGPALGGLTLLLVGPEMCFLLNAASYLAVLWRFTKCASIPEASSPFIPAACAACLAASPIWAATASLLGYWSWQRRPVCAAGLCCPCCRQLRGIASSWVKEPTACFLAPLVWAHW